MIDVVDRAKCQLLAYLPARRWRRVRGRGRRINTTIDVHNDTFLVPAQNMVAHTRTPLGATEGKGNRHNSTSVVLCTRSRTRLASAEVNSVVLCRRRHYRRVGTSVVLCTRSRTRLASAGVTSIVLCRRRHYRRVGTHGYTGKTCQISRNITAVRRGHYIPKRIHTTIDMLNDAFHIPAYM